MELTNFKLVLEHIHRHCQAGATLEGGEEGKWMEWEMRQNFEFWRTLCPRPFADQSHDIFLIDNIHLEWFILLRLSAKPTKCCYCDEILWDITGKANERFGKKSTKQ